MYAEIDSALLGHFYTLIFAVIRRAVSLHQFHTNLTFPRKIDNFVSIS